jgi:putative DNA primase/helicase
MNYKNTLDFKNYEGFQENQKGFHTRSRARRELLYNFDDLEEEYGIEINLEERRNIKKISRKLQLPYEVALINYYKQKEHMSEEELEEFMENLASNTENRKMDVNPSPEFFFDEGTFLPKKVSDRIRHLFTFHTFRETEEMLIYRDGVYERDGDTFVKETTNRLLDYRAEPHYSNKIVKQIKARTYTRRKQINQNSNLINLKNCVLKLPELERKEHSPKYLTTIQLPVNYDPNANCPKFKQFLDEILDTKTKKMKIQEMFGYSLIKDQKYQKAFLLYGDGSNGKSALLEILENLLGVENTSAVDLQELQESRFMVGRLYGKLSNIAGDIPNKTLKNTNRFKKLTGGDRIKGENKNEDAFFFRNSATLIFSANDMPKVENKQNAFYRRWCLIEFPYKFTEKNDQHKDKDKQIVEDIVGEEMSGILNWALKGLNRLQSQGSFTGQRKPSEIRKIYERNSSPIDYFLMEKTDRQGRIKKEELHDEYEKFRKKKGLRKFEYQPFCKKVLNKSGIGTSRPRINGDRIPFFTGVSLS